MSAGSLGGLLSALEMHSLTPGPLERLEGHSARRHLNPRALDPWGAHSPLLLGLSARPYTHHLRLFLQQLESHPE